MARRNISGRVCWWELNLHLLVAGFIEKAVFGRCLGGSLLIVAEIGWLDLSGTPFTGYILR